MFESQGIISMLIILSEVKGRGMSHDIHDFLIHSMRRYQLVSHAAKGSSIRFIGWSQLFLLTAYMITVLCLGLCYFCFMRIIEKVEKANFATFSW